MSDCCPGKDSDTRQLKIQVSVSANVFKNECSWEAKNHMAANLGYMMLRGHKDTLRASGVLGFFCVVVMGGSMERRLGLQDNFTDCMGISTRRKSKIRGVPPGPPREFLAGGSYFFLQAQNYNSGVWVP